MIGTTISHYKILEKLGEGGMGIVYKAEDLKLDRTVALKFLPHHLNASEEDQARFLQEAKAAATLNHPNVCVIHAIEEADGQQFIAMEYIDGVTLREKISASPLKMNDAITYAIQIGDALQEAHSKGIVHRDVKAENMMVNAKNQIKVMDFGLAKLKGSLKLTRNASTVGTLAYMAPEQIQGGEVDARSDIFSFGVVLYEMLSGKTPFHGEHEAAIMYSIVNEEPDAIQQYIPDASSELLHVLNRALEKDPADRYQNVQDMVIDLRRLKKDSTRVHRSSIHSAPTQVPGVESMSRNDIPVASSTSPTPTKSKKTIFIASGIGALMVLVVVFIMIQKKTPAINPDMKTRVLQIPFTQISYPALSPDGKWVAFPAADANGNWDIYYMHYSGGDAHRITFDSSAFGQQTADISPDGSMIVYDRMNPTTGRLEVCVVSSLGGITRRVAEVGSNPRWNPDGKTIGYCLGSSTRMRSPSGYLEFWTVNIDGTQKRQVLIDSLSSKSGSYRFSFCWSPTGESIGWISTSGGKQHIVIHDVATSEKRDLTSGGENIDDLCWTNAGQIIYSSNRGGNTNLWSIPAAGGEPVQITKGSGPDIGMKASAEGNEIVYLQQQTIGHIWLARLDGSLTKQLTFDDAPIFKPSISPDGKSIAFEMDNPDPLRRSTGIHIMDRDGNNRRRLSSGDEIMNNPVWSPDGRWIACSIGRGKWDSLEVGVIDASSPGVPKIVGRGIPILWIDNSHIVSVTNTRSLLNSTGGEPPRLISADSSYYIPVLNGKHMLVFDLRRRSQGWKCAEVQGPSVPDMIAGKSSWAVPVVARPKPLIQSFISLQGKNLFALDAQDKLVKFSLPDGRKETVKSSFPGLHRDQFGPTFSVGADGREIVYVDIRFNARLVMIENLLR